MGNWGFFTPISGVISPLPYNWFLGPPCTGLFFPVSYPIGSRDGIFTYYIYIYHQNQPTYTMSGLYRCYSDFILFGSNLPIFEIPSPCVLDRFAFFSPPWIPVDFLEWSICHLGEQCKYGHLSVYPISTCHGTGSVRNMFGGETKIFEKKRRKNPIINGSGDTRTFGPRRSCGRIELGCCLPWKCDRSEDGTAEDSGRRTCGSLLLWDGCFLLSANCVCVPL